MAEEVATRPAPETGGGEELLPILPPPTAAAAATFTSSSTPIPTDEAPPDTNTREVEPELTTDEPPPAPPSSSRQGQGRSMENCKPIQAGAAEGDSAKKAYTGFGDDLDLPFELTIDIKKSGKPKIAFLSGQEREYHTTDDLGTFAETPNPYYYPPSGADFLNRKPHSRKGYGIGGLSAPRFGTSSRQEGNSNSVHEKRPDPGVHQTIHMYPPRPRPDDVTNPVLRAQCRVAFDSSVRLQRFQEPSATRGAAGGRGGGAIPGPGTYTPTGKAGTQAVGCSAELKTRESFGGRKCVVPTVATVCRHVDGEKCGGCGAEQLYDYYRSIKPRPRPPGSRARGSWEFPEFDVLCRSCYCHAHSSRGHSIHTHAHGRWFGPKDLESGFMKVRHCSYKHDHQGLLNKITKATAKDIARLTRKEVLLAKYFKDCCPPEVKTASTYAKVSTSALFA